MKKRVSFLLWSLLALSIASCSNSTATRENPIHVDADQSWSVSSEDGTLNVTLTLSYGKLSYAVSKGKTAVVLDSPLAFTTNLNDFNALTFIGKGEKTFNVTYDNYSGKVSSVDKTCNELRCSFYENGFVMDVIFRVFNDGYGFQYGLRAADGSSGTVYCDDEKTYFNLPEKSYVHCLRYTANHDAGSDEDYYSYEGKYDTIRYDNMEEQTYVYPLMYECGDGVYALMNEAGLIGSGYHGSMLQKDETGMLKTIHSLASGSDPSYEIEYPFSSPWRVSAVGSKADVCESSVYEDILGNVEIYKNTDDGTDYSWVEPGVGIWNYLRYGGNKQSDLDFMRDYVDLVANMDWKWLILDANWNIPFDSVSFREFTSYAHAKDVKIMCWANIFSTFKSRSIIQLTLDNWKYYGIDGIKIDFWDGMYNDSISAKSKNESSETISLYEAFYQEAAKREMVVDCHGANKPTSERREYPNVINREAIYGQEWGSKVTASNSVYLSMIRCAVGPSDFTPATAPLKNDLSTCHSMALVVTMESGCPTLSGEIEEYWDEENGQPTEVGEFYQGMPAFWDETKLIQSDLDSNLSCTYARRKDSTWYVGGIVNKAGAIDVDYSFLEEGSWNCQIWQDGETNALSDVQKSEKTVTNLDSTSITCLDEGGFVMKLTKQEQ